MSSQKWLDEFIGLHPKYIDLDLSRVHKLLSRLDNPHKRLPPTIHVAGTNGKGSTIAFMRAMLETAGNKVHVYTSPHLVKFHERIRLCGELIEEEALCALFEQISDVNDSEPITFFEITTVAAFLAFSQTEADYLLLETGLGGRLDATNVIDQPLASVITPISLDHQQFLGEHITQIAFEKAHIQKSHVPSIIAGQHSEALGMLKKIAKEITAAPYCYGSDWFFKQIKENELEWQDQDGNQYLYPAPNLIGEHQFMNAATAIACLEKLRQTGKLLYSKAELQQIIKKGIPLADWPARLQRIEFGILKQHFPQAEILLDGGHNEAAGQILAKTLDALNDKEPLPTYIAVGMLNSKHASAFLTPLLSRCAHCFTLTIPDEVNSYTAEELAKLVPTNSPITPLSNINALPFALKPLILNGSNERFRLLITGSLYLTGKLLNEWRGTT